jgi:hypothetical protein
MKKTIDNLINNDQNKINHPMNPKKGETRAILRIKDSDASFLASNLIPIRLTLENVLDDVYDTRYEFKFEIPGQIRFK